MKEPGFLGYTILVTVCLLMAFIGLYILVNFSRLFRGGIKNEIIRRNIAAWLVIFFLSAAMSLNGDFF